MSTKWEEDLHKEYQPTMRLRIFEQRFHQRPSRLQQWWVAIGDKEDGIWVDIPVYGFVFDYDGPEERRY